MGKQNLLSVVVADDEQELLGAVCQLIDWEGIGFRLVGRASNGLDALQLVEELQPDFLLTDIHMPFISGTALAAQVKAVQPLIQVAFLSGYDEFEYAQQGIACEVIAYLLKPISMAQLTQERCPAGFVQPSGGCGGNAARLLLLYRSGAEPQRPCAHGARCR